MLKDFKFTPVLDSLILKYKEIYPALVFGKIWRYEQCDDRCCSASYQRIADELGISKSTVRRSVDKLLEDKLIKDISPNKFNIAGVTRKYVIDQQVLNTMLSQDTVSEDDTVFSQNTKDINILNNNIYISLMSSQNTVASQKEDTVFSQDTVRTPKEWKQIIHKITDPIDDWFPFGKKAEANGFDAGFFDDWNDTKKLESFYNFTIKYLEEVSS